MSKTQEAKLKEIIEIAIKGGITHSGGYKQMIKDGIIKQMVESDAYRNTLFSHSFAKAYWGKKEKHFWTEVGAHSYCMICGITESWDGKNPPCIPAWKLKLQQAVISNNVIDYYYEQTKNKKISGLG